VLLGTGAREQQTRVPARGALCVAVDAAGSPTWHAVQQQALRLHFGPGTAGAAAPAPCRAKKSDRFAPIGTRLAL